MVEQLTRPTQIESKPQGLVSATVETPGGNIIIFHQILRSELEQFEDDGCEVDITSERNSHQNQV